MKAGLAAVAALLLAGIAHADSSSTYDLYSTAGFDVNGEEINFSYSYQITIVSGLTTPSIYSTTDLNYIVVDSAGNDWTLDYFGSGEFAVSA